MIKPRAKKGWAIVNKKKPVFDLEDIHGSKEGFVLRRDEKWQRCEARPI